MKLDNFVGLYFRGMPTLISYVYSKNAAIFMDKKTHKIHENLNSTKMYTCRHHTEKLLYNKPRKLSESCTDLRITSCLQYLSE